MFKRIFAMLLALSTVLCLMAGCGDGADPTGGTVTTTPAPTTTVPADTAPADPWAGYDCLTIAQAIAICQQTGSAETAEKYYLRGTVTEISNSKYGNMTITDGTDTLFIYGTWSADGTTRFDALAEQPAVGDEVLLFGTLMHYNDTKPEMVNAWIIGFTGGSGGEEAVMPAPDSVLTVAEMLAMPLGVGECTQGRYYVTATILSVSNAQYGAMVIADETGEITIYASSSANGATGYADMENQPVKGDKVRLYCTVQNYYGVIEIKSAWIMEMLEGEGSYVPADYTDMTVLEARQAAKGTKVRLTGVVARVTYADGMVPLGFLLVDGTDSLYIYGTDAAAAVEVGNTVTVAGSKSVWIRDTEKEYAEKYGYTGCNQLEDVYLLENDHGSSDFDRSWITETTVHAMVNTDFDADVTGRIFKVTGIITRTESAGVVNYYINDLDGTTGSYCYSQCGCAEFDQWMRQFDGKLCTVYLAAQNAKSTSAGCIWRFLPVAVSEYAQELSDEALAAAALRLYALPQFQSIYYGDPAQALLTGIDGLLGSGEIRFTYSTSDAFVAYFVEADGKPIFHTNCIGNVTITVRATCGKYTVEETKLLLVAKGAAVRATNISEVIGLPVGEWAVVKGIVGPSIVAPEKTGFYLIDETGVIVVLTDAETMASLKIGYEVVISGVRDDLKKYDQAYYAGQTCISNATYMAIYYGGHDYPTDSFDGELSVQDFYSLDYTKDYTTCVFLVKGFVVVEETDYYSNIYISNVSTFDQSDPDNVYVRLYCSSANQYDWLRAYEGQEVTVEMAPTNYNGKNYYTGCVLAVVLEDGTKVVNTLNFN